MAGQVRIIINSITRGSQAQPEEIQECNNSSNYEWVRARCTRRGAAPPGEPPRVRQNEKNLYSRADFVAGQIKDARTNEWRTVLCLLTIVSSRSEIFAFRGSSRNESSEFSGKYLHRNRPGTKRQRQTENIRTHRTFETLYTALFTL